MTMKSFLKSALKEALTNEKLKAIQARQQAKQTPAQRRLGNNLGIGCVTILGAMVLFSVYKAATTPYTPPPAITVEAPAVPEGHHINTTISLFVSKEAMSMGLKMIAQGMTDSDILAPYYSCVAREGDSFISLHGSWTVSEIMLTDGANRGCQGWTANEFLARKP